MNLTAKNIFLIDGIGALITTILLSLFLTTLESFFGMPVHTLRILAIIAFLISAYSLVCYYFFTASFNTLLIKVIITTNIAYCILTIVLIFSNLKSLTAFGIFYFFGELIIILFLVKKEYSLLDKQWHN